jgi:integrase
VSYLSQLKKEGVSRGTAVGYLSAYKLFFDVNGYTLNGKRLARSLPPKQKLSKDRGYTREEIARMLQGADERLRALILLLASTGMRIGAIADKYEPRF